MFPENVGTALLMMFQDTVVINVLACGFAANLAAGMVDMCRSRRHRVDVESGSVLTFVL